jgi:hypothetical protein
MVSNVPGCLDARSPGDRDAMTRDAALDDPEVRVDLALRDRTARARSDRRGPAGLDRGQDPDGLSPEIAQLYASTPDPIVERWPCIEGCGALVDMTAAAIERHTKFSERLERRGERPLVRRVPCAGCMARADERRQAQRWPHEQRTIAGLEPGKGRP